MAYLPVAQQTAWQNSSDIDLGKTAILVVDVLGGNEGTLDVLQEMADNSVAIVKAARAKGLPVIFTCDAHIPAIDREMELWGEHGIVDTQGSLPLDAFEVQKGDFIIPKRRYDSFFQTDLDITLRELGVDTLIVVGCDTNICVHHTLAGAYYRCYKTIVPADATQTFLVGDQAAGLEYFTRCFDTRVVDTATVLGYLA